ncbi:MAG: MFS transporter [Acidimicrobiales bacterium]|nr:MFS transporter [Acidimicrobiales bacterium]
MGVTRPARTIWSPDLLPVTLANVTVMALAAFDGLAVVGALPSITEDLGKVALSPWVLTSYLAVSAVAGIAAGPAIDAVGVRRTFRVTVVWFLVSSILATIAPTMETLIAARVLQGLGGGLVISVVLASVGLAYEPELRPRAFAANSVVWGIMGFGGPALVGLVLAFGDWRWIFGIQIPLTSLALAMGWNRLPSTRERPQRIETDWVGIGFVALFVFASILATSLLGVSALGAAAGAVVALVSAVAYWRHSGREPEPVLARQHLVSDPMWRIHLSAGLIMMAGISDAYLPLYAQATRGWSESAAAFTVLFVTVGWTGAAIVMSRLLDRIDEVDGIAIGGFLIVPATFFAALGLWFDWPFPVILAAFFAMGMSLGALTNAGLSLLQSTSASNEMGRTNSAHQFIRSMAITFAVAVGGAVLLWVVGNQVGDVEVVRDLLAGEDIAVGADTAAAIGDGLAAVLTISVVLAIGCFATTQSLRKAMRSQN